MNKNNNLYVILYATIMVIIVAIGLAFTSESLKDRQEDNANIDTMRQILRSLDIDVKANEAQARYAQIITDAYLVDANGNVLEDTKGVAVTDPAFLAEASKMKSPDTKGYPVFVATIDGQTKYVLVMYGAGLWGPIWGYISLDEDMNTVYGTDFSHASETPGLGAEIVKPEFRRQFVDKKLYRDGQFTSIAVVKPGKSDASRDYVDGISGGTLTSKGVDAMLAESLKLYDPFLTNAKK